MILRTPSELGHLAREVRTLRRLTQAHLATQVGVSRKWVIDLEAGKRTAELALVLRTLNALGVEIDARVRGSKAAAPPKVDINDIVAASRRRK